MQNIEEKIQGDHEVIFLSEDEKNSLMDIAKEEQKKNGKGSKAALGYLLKHPKWGMNLSKFADVEEPTIVVSPVVKETGFLTVYVGDEKLKVNFEYKDETKIKEVTDNSKITEPEKKPATEKKPSSVKKPTGAKKTTTNKKPILEKKVKDKPKVSGKAKEKTKKLLGKKSSTKDGAESSLVEPIKASATKISPLQQDDPVVSILRDILDFMKKSYDEDKLAREEALNRAEGLSAEQARKDKELLDALKKGEKPTAEKTKEEKKEDDDKEPSIFEKILGGIMEGFNFIKDILGGITKAFGGGLKLLMTIGRFFLTSPLGIALLTGAALGTIIWKLWKNSDPQKVQESLAGKGPEGAAVAGPGGAQYESYDDEQKQKQLEQRAKAFDKKGLKDSSIEELEAKKELMISNGYAKTKAKEIKEIDDEIKSRKQKTATPVQQAPTAPKAGAASAPTASPASTSSTPAPTTSPSASSQASPMTAVAEPPSSPPVSDKLNEVSKENIDIKLQEEFADTMGNKITNIVKNTKSALSSTKSKLPPVRNQEPTFQRMIYNSTRVV